MGPLDHGQMTEPSEVGFRLQADGVPAAVDIGPSNKVARVRDPWGLNERLFARYYPIVAGWSEAAGQSETRRKLLSEARGRTLEIGAGNGYNSPHYPATVTQLVLTEPSPHMLTALDEQLRADDPAVGSWQLMAADATRLPFDDGSFDTVVASFVHCTIPSPATALGEIARVLKPDGRYLFMEHVRAREGTLLARIQDAVELPHRYLAAGCHPNRRTAELLDASPLNVVRIEHGRMPRSSPTVRPVIHGIAEPRS
jgi:SAM-dependent methyltransferase